MWHIGCFLEFSGLKICAVSWNLIILVAHLGAPRTVHLGAFLNFQDSRFESVSWHLLMLLAALSSEATEHLLS